MSIFFSASTGGFYIPDINANLFVEHVDTDPETGQTLQRYFVPDPNGPIADAVEITAAEHQALLYAQSSGSRIEADASGKPVAVAPTPPTLDEIKVSLCAQVDAAADASYAAVGGNSPGRIAEYKQAKADADAFKAGGYTGTVPATIDCWAQAQGWTAQAACDDILATAAQWEGVLVGIRTARLVGKGNVRSAANETDAQAAASTAISNIRSVIGG